MYRSLYKILKSKVDAKATGLIRLLHASGQQGAVELENGNVTGVEQGDLYGVDAAKRIIRWVNVAVTFVDGEALELPQEKRLNTQAALDQLQKIDARVKLFKEQIGGCDAVFQFIGQQIAGTHQFSPQELNLSFLLDGNASIKEVQAKTDLSELDVLLTVCKFIKHQLVRVVHPHQPMDADRRSVFLEQLENTLSDITGPVASVIINDAFEAIGAPAEELAECDISHLYAVIISHLEDDEKEAFTQWTQTFA